MFNFLKKKHAGELVTFKIEGMHCTSCSMNIDGVLEDVEGVVEARTSYAKQETKIIYDSSRVKAKQLEQVIAEAGYIVKV